MTHPLRPDGSDVVAAALRLPSRRGFLVALAEQRDRTSDPAEAALWHSLAVLLADVDTYERAVLGSMADDLAGGTLFDDDMPV